MEIKATTRDDDNVLGYTMAMSNLTKRQFFSGVCVILTKNKNSGSKKTTLGLYVRCI